MKVTEARLTRALGETGTLEFRLLGPVEAVRDGDPLAVGGRRQRALLAILLMARGRVVPADVLSDALWAGEPPDGAATTLRSYVSRLRSVLGSDAPIIGSTDGYAMSVLPERVDASRFQRLTDEGERALTAGAFGRAAERFGEALGLWRGRPFGELADDGPLRIEADRLEQRRLHAIERRIEAELELGGAAGVVEELETLISAHPYREGLWRRLMLALYRAGRQADALAAYKRARTVLRGELGVEPTEELKALERAILRQEVPPAKGRPLPQELPAPLTSFVGREAELGETADLLAESRLLTLTGVGGVGKTRLALELAARSLADFTDGACFVDLGSVTDGASVEREVARALDIREQPGMSLVAQLTDRLRSLELLLVLDNCEQMREACAELAQAVLSGSPHVRILATSRVVLGAPGEVDYAVPPLAIPPLGAGGEELRRNESVALLMTRARASRPRFPTDDAVLVDAARICRDLDGIPLAIELAAARAKALSLDEIATRLDDRFRFLVSWRRLTPARHQTLKQVLDWSYELLAADERRLLGALSIFVGGFPLDAVAAICLGGDEEAALERLQRLVEASLVVPQERAGATRYRLLETVRRYAATTLDDATATAMRRRHAEHFASLAVRAEPELTGEHQAKWFTRLDEDHDDLRAALTQLERDGDAETLLRATVALTRFWYVRGHLAEARERLDRVLARSAELPAALRRRALTAAAAVALLQGDHDSAVPLAERSLAAARETGDVRLVANGLSNLGAIVLAAGDDARAGTLLEEAVAIARTTDDERILALALNNLADHALTVGDHAGAEPLFRESLALLQRRGDTSNVARSLFNLGAVALRQGRVDEAGRHFRESLERSRETGDKEDLAWCLVGIAAVAAALDDGLRGAVLLGAAGRVLAEMGATFKPFERQLHDETEARVRAMVGVDEAAARRAAGEAMSLDDALRLAAQT